jgi:Cys-rich protein (TIGR01571 family)
MEEQFNDENPEMNDISQGEYIVPEAQAPKEVPWNSDVEKTGNKLRKIFPIRECVVPLPSIFSCFNNDDGHNELRFNPLTSILSLAVLWGLSIYCMVAPDSAKSALSDSFTNVTEHFTWLFIIANPTLTFFIIWLAFRFGNIKLGSDPDAKPEFSDASYFAMIFSAGVGIGLIFFGVSEPLLHQSSNYFSNAGYHNQDEVDQWSLLITINHWGVQASWAKYLIMSISISLAAYRFDLPMTVRSAFYPILGEYTWGWIGDLIDGFSIVMTVAGICTSLGLGVLQMTVGLERLGWIDTNTDQDSSKNEIIIIWVVTIFATMSVISGLKVGIKTLAFVALGTSSAIMFLSFVMEDTMYLLNLIVQTTGMYLQYGMFQLTFWTDAFGSMQKGEGRAIDGTAAATWWMGGWTVFYSAWWVSWIVFVGLFVARISKNRTIRNVIVSVGLASTFYCILWFCIMGGIGLRQQRQALELQVLGGDVYNNTEYYLALGSSDCYDVPQADVTAINEEGEVATLFTNALPGVTPVCLVPSGKSQEAWFNVMDSFSYPDADGNFSGFGPFLTFFSVFTLVIYFVTSSDSGSLVVDTLASNGATKHHWLQRVFWALTEGAVAAALLVAGGSDALTALQSASLIFALPFNALLFVMCVTIVMMCQAIEKSQNSTGPKLSDPSVLLPKKTWNMPVFGGILNIFEFIFSVGFVHPSRKENGMGFPTSAQSLEFVKGLLLPFMSLHAIYTAMDTKRNHRLSSLLTSICFGVVFLAMVGLFICGVINNGFIAFGWTAFLLNACILTSLRVSVRERLAIRGNIIADFLVSSFLYPQALAQMVLELKEHEGTLPNHEE